MNNKQEMHFEFTYLGVEHEQYFQGFGVSFTEFDRCTCGIGETPAEAADDAVEQACHDLDVITSSILEKAYDEFVASLDNVEESTDLDDGFHHHVGIRWKSD